MSQAFHTASSSRVTSNIDHCHLSLVFIVALFVCPWYSRAASGLELLCDSATIGRHLVDGELQKALELSIKCEKLNLRNSNKNFANPNLKGAYLVSAQILTAQGKFDIARERINRAKAIPDSFLIALDELVYTTDGYLLERSGRTAKAIKFYEKLATPLALVELGKIHLDAGRTDDALSVITQSLKLDPSSPAAHAILGEILERSDKTAALREYRRSLALATERRNPTVVALVYLEVARAKRGIDRLQ